MIKNGNHIISSLVLVLANLFPIYGVLYLNWNIAEIMLLYWSESAIIGFFNILKMLKVPDPTGQRTTLIPFFCIHYGMFMFVHFIFLSIIVLSMMKGFTNTINTMIEHQAYLSFTALFMSHGLSYMINFIGRREYEGTDLNKLFIQPYGRIIAMHLTIIFGFIVTAMFKTSFIFLILLTILKIIVDLFAHFKEHAKSTT